MALSESKKGSIVHGFANGMNISEVREHAGVSVSVPDATLRTYHRGLPSMRKGKETDKWTILFNEYQDDNIKLWRESYLKRHRGKMTLSGIAGYFENSIAAKPQRKIKTLSQEDKDDIMRCFAAGMKVAEIQRELGLKSVPGATIRTYNRGLPSMRKGKEADKWTNLFIKYRNEIMQRCAQETRQSEGGWDNVNWVD